MTACRLALTLWGALFLAGLLAWLTHDPRAAEVTPYKEKP